MSCKFSNNEVRVSLSFVVITLNFCFPSGLMEKEVTTNYMEIVSLSESFAYLL